MTNSESDSDRSASYEIESITNAPHIKILFFKGINLRKHGARIGPYTLTPVSNGRRISCAPDPLLGNSLYDMATILDNMNFNNMFPHESSYCCALRECSGTIVTNLTYLNN